MGCAGIPGVLVFETYSPVYCDSNTLQPLRLPPEPGLPTTGWRIRIPLVTITIVLWVLPVLAFARGPLPRLIRLRADRRRARGLCINCGYDLTGNVSGVCPECGTPLEGANTFEGETAASTAQP